MAAAILSSELLWLPPATIWVDRSIRQRAKLATKGLVESVKKWGILHPLVVEPFSASSPFGPMHKLVSGERRLASALQLNLPTVPCRLFSDLSPAEVQMLELEENIKREDLAWQDKVVAVERIHRLLSEASPGQTHEATADTVGVTRGLVSIYLRVARDLGDERVSEAATVNEAWNYLHRRDERAYAAQQQRILDDLDTLEENPGEEEPEAAVGEAGPPGTSPGLRPSLRPMLDPSKSILHEDFLQWAPRYSGPKFNLLHCDFPYGIGVFSGPQMQGSGHRYDDSEKLYFGLIQALCNNLDRLCSISSHLMFWYSEKHGDRTREMFRELAPSWSFYPFPLVWVKSDNSGIAADSQQHPRHVYETALLATRGRRKIVRVVADAYSAPSDRRLHVSAKPIPVLRHFFTMLVDEHTSLLDPTCGSANALVAAELGGASSVLGLEVDETQCGIARQALRGSRATRGAAAAVGGGIL